MNRAAIASYESNSFYTDKDVYALANISELFYQQHEDNKEVYDAICEAEQNLKDAAEERETQGVWKTVAGVGLLVVGGVCIVASWGAATPVVAAAEGIVGTGTTIFGVADSAEGAQDIYYGSIGDIDSTAVNDLKDGVFQGNEEAYYLAESVFAFAASAMIPIGQAASAGNLTFRSGATIVAKEGIATAAGAGAQKYTTDLTGNQTAGMIAGMAASMATAQGLNGIEAGVKKLAKPKLGDVGADGGAVLNDADVGSAVKSGSPTQGYSNFADGMSPEDAIGYVLNNEKAFFNEFSERASAAGLSDTQIAEAFDAMRNGDYAKMATYFDTSSPVDGAVFWSGNKEGAAAYANSIGGTIMEQTPGGQVFDNWRGLGGMYPEWDTPTNLAQKPIWDALSSQYANGAEGIATYAHPDGYVGKVWSNIEKPILEENDIIIQEVIIDAK